MLRVVSDGNEGVVGTEVAAVGGRRIVHSPEAIVAVLLLEILEERLGHRPPPRRPRPGREHQSGEIGPRQCPGLVHRQISHPRHAVIFELPEAQCTRPVGEIGHERTEQEFPVRGNGHRPLPADGGKVLLPLLEIGDRQHPAVGIQPLRPFQAVVAAILAVPTGGKSAAEPKQQLLHQIQVDVVGGHLDGEHGDVDVVKEIEVDVGDREAQRLGPILEGDADAVDVPAPEHPHRPLAIAALARVAIEKPLHRRQKGDELAVMPDLHFADGARELVLNRKPGIIVPAQPGPALRHMPPVFRRQLHRPEQYLAEMTDQTRRLVG